jgi:hypothetical protein
MTGTTEPTAATSGASDRTTVTALRDRRLRRRRQVHPDRPAAARLQVGLRPTSWRPWSAPRADRGQDTPTSRCSPTACGPSASRASRSTWRTATSPRPRRRFILADTPGTCSTPATWSPAPPRPSWRSSWSTPATASSSRPAGTRRSRAAARAARRAGGQQDGPRRLRGVRLRAIAEEFTATPPSWACPRSPDPDVGARRRQRGGPSARMDWYEGPTLLEHLESVPVGGDRTTARALPRAVRDPSARRAPGLPGLRGPITGIDVLGEDDVAYAPAVGDPAAGRRRRRLARRHDHRPGRTRPRSRRTSGPPSAIWPTAAAGRRPGAAQAHDPHGQGDRQGSRPEPPS